MFDFDGMSFVKISTMSDVLPCVGPWFEPNFTAHIRTLLTEKRSHRQARTPLQSVKVRHPTKTTNTVHPQKQVRIEATDISAEEAMYQQQTEATASDNSATASDNNDNNDSSDNSGAERELRSETQQTEEETREKQSPMSTSNVPSDGGTTDEDATSDTNSTRAEEETLSLSTTTDAELETEDRDT